jgi:protein-disulfide isomerase/rhodanese-related sulfurtransferase
MRKTLLLLLSLVGLFDSLYLWWTYTTPDRPMVCLGDGCDAVRASPFAYPMGIPLPLPGVLMYAVLALLIFAEPLFSAAQARLARNAVAGISGLGFLVSLYLTGLEAFVIHAWCFWCVISAIVVTLIFGLAVLDVLRPLPEPEPAAALVAARNHLVCVVAAVIVGIPAFIWLAKSGTPPPLAQIPPEVLELLVRPDSHVAGNPEARLTVVEFGDIQCPACSGAEETARAVRNRYHDRVRFVFRHFPLPSIHRYAQKAAEATECAAAQGKFWEALQRFYEGQHNLREEALVGYARDLGLDVEQFRQCLTSGAMAERVARDADDARALGLRATPTFFVGGRVIEGPMELGIFSNLVEQELARLGSAPAAPTVASGSSPATSSTTPAPPAPAVKPPTASTAPAPGFAPSGTFGQSPFGGLQLGAAEVVCSEADALKEQATLIGTPEARKMFEGNPKALFVDVREPKEFQAGRIPGAVNIPVGKISEQEDRLPKDRTIVLYESGKGSGDDICAAGRAAGRILLARGFSSERVKVYHDGLAGWEKAGLPAER